MTIPDELLVQHTLSLDLKYTTWIRERTKAEGGPQKLFGICKQVTDDMVVAFPELTQVRGHAYVIPWGLRTHWWCVAPDGAIVDPTADQYPAMGVQRPMQYTPLDPDAEEPIGMCMECGELCFPSRGGTEVACSEAHLRAIEAEYNIKH